MIVGIPKKITEKIPTNEIIKKIKIVFKKLKILDIKKPLCS
jgi:hypothetical protein